MLIKWIEHKSEPLQRKCCGREECFSCSTEGGKCETNGAGYRIRCLTCLRAGKSAEYVGETGRNSYTWGLEHMAALRLEDQDNALWRHCMIEHQEI